MYEGFKKFDIQTSDPQVKIHGVIGGNGPPLLLLHGNPLTHVHWHIVAPLLAKDYTVVATDLRGYGDSGKPRGRPVGTTTSNKTQVALRIDNDTLERFKAAGPGWQSRINAVLRKAVGL